MTTVRFLPMTPFAVETLRAAEKSARDAGRPTILPVDVIVGTLDRGRSGVGPVALQAAGVSLEQARALARTSEAHVRDDRGSDAEALAALGIDLEEVRRRMETSLGEGSLSMPEPAIAPSDALLAAAHAAVDEATSIGQDFLGTEHLLLGVLAHDEKQGGDLTRRLGISGTAIRERIFAGMAFVSFLFSAAGERFVWDEVAEVKSSVDALEGGAWDAGMALVQTARQGITSALSAAYESRWPELSSALAASWLEHLNATVGGDDNTAASRRSEAFAILEADPDAMNVAASFGEAARSEVSRLRTGVEDLTASGTAESRE